MITDIHLVLGGLAALRPIFHSEADFQHALAWEFHTRMPAAAVRLERPFHTPAGLLHVDIALSVAEQVLALELKYKTRALVLQTASETFALQDHGAQPPSRYDTLKDLTRLELLAAESPRIRGFLIFLTNDSAYWSEPRGTTDSSAAFSLHDGRTISGRLEWASSTSPGTKRHREAALELRRPYTLKWHEYSTVEARSYARFRYFAVEVLPG